MTCVGVYAFDGPRKEVVDGCAERSSNRMRNRLWFYRASPVGVFSCQQRLRESGAKHKTGAGKACRAANKVASGDTHGVLLRPSEEVLAIERADRTTKSWDRNLISANWKELLDAPRSPAILFLSDPYVKGYLTVEACLSCLITTLF